MEVADLFNYNPETGDLTWAVRGRGRSLTKPVGTVRKGYKEVMIGDKFYQVHRICFYKAYGYLPEMVDHKDLNRGNNRKNNLRDATAKTNGQNRPMQSNNRTGYKGVTPHRGKFAAQCSGKYIGSFNTAEEAYAAYVEYAKREHGEFFNGN